MRHLLRTRDLDEGEFLKVVERGLELKEGGDTPKPMRDGSLGLLFEKSSTRTRVSMEVAARSLGGGAIYLPKHDLQLGRGESVDHTSRVLSSYLSAVAIRTGDHGLLKEFAERASCPVINALSDESHPCQALADLLTLREEFRDLSEATAAWVGDGNNVANSFIEACGLTGTEIRVATPKGYGPDPSAVAFAEERTDVTVTTDPEEAVAGADAVYTDVWVSMGDEEEEETRMEDFEGYRVTEDLLAASKDARVMHCMPIQGPEIEDSLVDSERSVIFRQAENRLHASKALLEFLL